MPIKFHAKFIRHLVKFRHVSIRDESVGLSSFFSYINSRMMLLCQGGYRHTLLRPYKQCAERVGSFVHANKHHVARRGHHDLTLTSSVLSFIAVIFISRALLHQIVLRGQFHKHRILS